MSKKKFHKRGRCGALTQRQLRVGEMLRHALSEILIRGDIRDPDLEGQCVTITEVQVAPDMRSAVAYCTSLGGQNDAAILDSLNRSQAYVRGQLGRMIKLKFTPTLAFLADTTFSEAQSIDALLRSPRVAQDLGTSKTDDSHGETT